MINEESNKAHYLIALLLLIVGLLIMLIFVSIRSQADTSTETAQITSTAPSVNSVTISESTEGSAATNITVPENTTDSKIVYVWGTYTDNNGCDTVEDQGASNYLVLSHSTTDKTCDQDYNDCYTATAASYTCDWDVDDQCTTGGSVDTATYECSVPMQYLVKNGTWTATIHMTDGALTNENTDDVTLDLLTSLNLSGDIAFGNVEYNASSSEKTLTVTNTGNDTDLDITYESTDMACTRGVIDATSIKWDTTASVAYSSKNYTASSTAAQDVTNFNLDKATASASPSTKDTYWQLLAAPHTGYTVLSGTCTGTLTIGTI